MCRPEALSAWIAELETVFPSLSKPQVKMLGQYSYGMILAQRCGLSSVAAALAYKFEQPLNTVRERLRDWYCSGPDKSGRRRRSLDVQGCFAPLLGWVLNQWHSDRLAIALDATQLGQRFIVLVISVVYRGGAIPVAWVVLPAMEKGSWKPHWIELLKRFKDLVPPSMTVIVLADRGLYAKWLFEQIIELDWHPFLRVNAARATFTPAGGDCAVELKSIPAGDGYAATGTLFGGRKTRLSCTLAARHDEGYADAWHVVSDLPPDQLEAAWYGLRAWIERGFKHTKTGGWNWQMTRMTDADRAGKLWLAMAVAGVLVMRQGAAQETGIANETTATGQQDPDPTMQAPAAQNSRTGSSFKPGKTKRRVLSVFSTTTLMEPLNNPTTYQREQGKQRKQRRFQ